jgi:uncharacterized protein (TIGR02996 family)
VNLRNTFLKALADNEDDTTTRLIYADWLEEQGEHEEADRQRQWPTAKEWLVRFCQNHNPPPDDQDPYEMVISYAELIELEREAIEEADDQDFGLSCGNNMTMCDALRANRQEFWQNWSIVTGIPLPPDAETRIHFRCAC